MKNLFYATFIMLLFISCTQSDYSNKETQSNQLHRLTDKDIFEVSKMMLTPSNQGTTKKLAKAEESMSPSEGYTQILAAQNMTMQIDTRLLPIMDNTYEENIEFLKNRGLLNNSEINIINDLNNQINTTHNFENSISKFENSILNLSLSIEKKQKYINFIDGLKILNQMEPEYFKGDLTPPGSLFGSCLSASIGVGIAFVGLATIEVGSFGLGTGAAVVGFIWASAEWGKACSSNGKKVYPAPVAQKEKSIEEYNPYENFLTKDDDFANPRFVITLIN